MSKQGDDCYFYFYSTCTKGDNCSFRHCEAALGNETVCTLWQEGRCFRNVCRFRHMEIDKKRAEIPCYWEKQPVGCQKANCAFHHAKGRYIDGVFLPPSKNQLSAEGEETKTPVQQPAEEGQNGLRMISTRKASATTAKQEDGLNFGIKTLEEIKLQKMKEKTKRHGEGPSRSSLPPVDSMIFPAPEKENVRTVVRTVTLSTEEGEEPVVRLDLAEKQGKRKASVADVSALPVKRSLAERLGKKVEVPGNADKAPKRVQVPKSVKERLGLPSQRTSTAKGKAAKPKGEIHVKTLEEIRRERALQRRECQAKAQAEWHGKTKDPSAGAKIQGEPKKQSVLTLSGPSKVQSKEPAGKAKPEGEVRVKTLEEIKREKALRMQQSGGNVPAPPAQPGPAPAGQKSLWNTKLSANFNMFAKPWDGKVASPKKKALKRKAPGSFPSAVAAVKPRTASDADTMGPPAKKAAMAVPATLEHVPATRLEENPQNRPEAHLGSQAESVEPMEFSSSTSASSQLEEARTRRLSSTGNAPVSVDEDLETLLWELSDGILEAELDLDPGKDEDDLLLELSKMIDD